jgi:hypothetical protein
MCRLAYVSIRSEIVRRRASDFSAVVNLKLTDLRTDVNRKLADLPTKIHMWGALGVLTAAYAAGLAALAVLKQPLLSDVLHGFRLRVKGPVTIPGL